MQQDLSRIATELRKETCPRRVLDEVERQISQQKSAPTRLRLALGAIAGFVLVVSLSVWLWQRNENTRPQTTSVERPRPERALVAKQAQAALVLVGSELLDASAHSEKIISDRAVPPLRNSIETAKNKLTHPMEL